jgi:hypothetical protein
MLREPFDLNLFVKAMNCFNGQHNFSAFTTKSGRFEMIKNGRCPIKTVKIGKFYLILKTKIKISF